jgi:hypothetical protein
VTALLAALAFAGVVGGIVLLYCGWCNLRAFMERL